MNPTYKNNYLLNKKSLKFRLVIEVSKFKEQTYRATLSLTLANLPTQIDWVIIMLPLISQLSTLSILGLVFLG